MKVRNLRNQARAHAKYGPGTVIARMGWLMRELERRFPNPNPFSSICSTEVEYIRDLDAKLISNREEIKALREALTTAVQALNDWTATFASEHCSDEMVEAAQNRLSEYGTIAYIADIVKQSNNALRK